MTDEIPPVQDLSVQIKRSNLISEAVSMLDSNINTLINTIKM